MKKNDLEFFNLDETAEWDRFEVEVAINEELKKSSDEEMLMESDTAIVKETKQIIAKKSLDEEYDYVPKKTVNKEKSKASKKAVDKDKGYASKEVVKKEKRQTSKKAVEEEYSYVSAKEVDEEYDYVPKKKTGKKTAAISTKIKDGSSAKKTKKTKQLKEADTAVKSSTGKKKKSGKKSKKEEQGFFGDLLAYFQNMSLLDGLVAATGVLVLVVAIITVSAFGSAKMMEEQMAAFAPLGEEMYSLSGAGNSVLLAMADEKKATQFIEGEEEFQEEVVSEVKAEEEEQETVQVKMKLTSLQKDLKIKFVNNKTGKLISGIKFKVSIKGGKGNTIEKEDDDKDGIIYLTNMAPGDIAVTLLAESVANEDVSVNTETQTINIKANIEYKKVDVADEIKTEGEVNAAVEDTAAGTAVEGELKDTVEWVESTKTPLNTKENYEKIDKSKIVDPASVASTDLFFMRSLLPGLLTNGVMPIDEPDEGGVVEEVVTPEGNTPSTPEGDTPPSSEGSNGSGSSGESGGSGSSQVKDEVTKISLNKSSIELTVGGSEGLSASVEATGNPDKSVTWSSSDSSVATVSGGTVTGVKAGTATITASAGGKTATCSVKVTEQSVSVTAVKMSEDKLTVETGKTAALSATVEPSNATDKSVTWSSSDTSVATVSGGTVTGVKAGTATITATAGGKSASCVVTVSNATVTVTGITLDKSSENLMVGKKLTLTAKVAPDNASNKSVTWKSSDTSIATVDNGVVKGIKVGTATITATTVDQGKTATCKITVKADLSGDTKTKLKDKSGNQVYYKSDGKYYEATYADYYKDYKFYILKKDATEYKYTGWQHLDDGTYYFDKNGKKVTGEQVIQGAKYNFGSDGKIKSGSGTLGIDVSKWNGNINWEAVKNSGVSYVIIRCGYRGSTTGALIEDPKFKANIQGASKAGLKVGIYFFTQAVSEAEAVEEASMTVNLIKGYKISYPVFLDVESSGGRADGLDRNTRTKVIKAYCETIRNSGYTAGVYANKTWLESYMNTSELSKYKIWLAQYNSNVTYKGRYDLWQYSSKGSVGGIGGHTDMNLSYLGY